MISKKRLKNKSHEEIIQILNDAFLNIDVEECKLNNPLDWPPEFSEEPHIYLSWILTQPQYFSFICAEILKIELLPFQGVILEELWGKRFPMLIGSRGVGKSFILAVYALLRALLLPNRKILIAGASFRQSKVIFNYIEGIWNRAPLLRDICHSYSSSEFGPKHSTDMYYCRIGGSIITAIPVGPGGDKIRGQRAHDLLCVSKETLINTNNGLIKIVDYLDGKTNTVLNINKQFEKPSHLIITDPTDVYQITTRNGFTIKCSSSHRLMTDSGWKFIKDLTTKDRLEIDSTPYFPQNYITFEDVTVDENLGYFLGILISEGSIETRHSIGITNTDYNLLSYIKNKFQQFNWSEDYKPAYIDKRGFDCKESWVIRFTNTKYREKLKKLGLDYCIHKDKEIPWCILQSPKSVVIEFLKGLFAGDGTGFQITPRGRTRKKSIGLTYYSRSYELCRVLQILLLNFGIYGTLNSRKSKLSQNKQWMLKMAGENAVLLYELLGKAKWGKLIHETGFRKAKPQIRKNGKRYCLSTTRADKNIHLGTFDSIEECNLKFIVYQQQTRKLFKIRSITKLDKEILYDFHMPDSHSFIGNGFVNHNCDEMNSIPREIFETVMVGFTAVSSDPLGNVKDIARRKRAKELNIELNQYIDDIDQYITPNQLVMSGTAGYSFEQFYDYWQDWHDIIESKGNPKKLERYLAKKKQNSDSSIENILENLNYKDYSIIRIPFELIPKGFMDEAQVMRSKATIHSGTYLCEYGACITNPDELILTDQGFKKWIDLKYNDMVLSDDGCFYPIINKTYRKYHGYIYKIYTYGSNIPMSVTSNHQFFNGENYEPLLDHNFLYYPKLKELSGLNKIDLSEYTNSGIVYDNHLYTKYPNQQMNQDKINLILSLYKNKLTQIEIAKKINERQSKISYILKNNKNRKKCSLNRFIKLNFDFGLIIGYYAAEGSIGSDGRQCEFAIGLHEPHYYNQLMKTINKVFGIQAKLYIKENVASVNVNSRIFSELMTKICPGDCYSKTIDSKILYSNSEFLRGFLHGLINGDGCLHESKYDKIAKIGLSSLSLISQVRTALTFFGIYGAFYYKSATQAMINDRLCNVEEKYILDIRTEYLNKLYKEIYNIDYNFKTKTRFIKDFKDYFQIKIKNIEVEQYSGTVYNIEVDKNHTYSLNNALCHNCFADDSNGFFRRSTINACSCGPNKLITHPGYDNINFNSILFGDRNLEYIMGIDPASEQDNFAIVILELHKNHRRVVYTWTTNKKQQKYELDNNLTTEQDYYAYCVLRIRALMKRFNIIRIVLDPEGGGRSIREGLMNERLISQGEQRILEIVEEKDKDTDLLEGLHILEMAKFSTADWLAEANNGLRHDLERKLLIFPYFDSAALAIAEGNDLLNDRIYDTLEYCMEEIEELKNELSTIVMTRTPSGRDRWDTPEVKLPGGKKGRERKDRYSALLIANMAARKMMNDITYYPEAVYGGFAQPNSKSDGKLYNGNEEFNKAIMQVFNYYG